MGYISKELLQKAYKELSNLKDEHLQGQTQAVSAIRYFFALDMFCTAKETNECDLNITENRTLFVNCVRLIVNIYDEYYTTNFYTTIKPLQDCGVNSNFYSQSVVSKSVQNTNRVYEYPTRGQNPLFKVQANVLKRDFDYYENIGSYLNTNELKQAFAIWLLRNEDINSLTENSIKDALLDNFSEDIIEELMPDDSNIEDFTDGFTLSDTKPVLDENDFLSLFEIMPTPQTSTTPLPHQRQQIFYGAPGTGKSHTIKSVVEEGNFTHIRTTFHPDSDYSTFVGAYKPSTINVPMRDVSGHIIVEDGKQVIESKIIYTFVPQAFLKAYVAAWKNQNQPFFLIIEEINRGNCAQIFGDLFQLLDRDDNGWSKYHISPDNDIQKFLQTDTIYGFAELDEELKDSIPDEIRFGVKMKLPPNLYIWATMNTSDQSLFPIDSAFKRRWDWKYIRISEGNGKDGKPLNYRIQFKTTDGNIVDVSWWEFVKSINKDIEDATKSEDKKLGYFFCKPDKKANDDDETNTIISAETFVGKVVFYLWQDVFKDYGFKSDIFKKDNGEKISFHDFYPDNITKTDDNPEAIDLDLVKRFIDKVMKITTSDTTAKTTEE